MKTVIIDYGAGNVRSVLFALERCGINAICTNDVEEIKSAEKVIFPGVGEAQSAMMELKKMNLDKIIPQLKQPVLGVCLGMQLLCDHSEEGDTNCLRIVPLNVKRFQEAEKIPHIGWNTIDEIGSNLFAGISDNSFVYYVHSYYVPASPFTIASTSYGEKFSAAIQKDNFYGCQFHPEKSSDIGEKVLQNFLKIDR